MSFYLFDIFRMTSTLRFTTVFDFSFEIYFSFLFRSRDNFIVSCKLGLLWLCRIKPMTPSWTNSGTETQIHSLMGERDKLEGAFMAREAVPDGSYFFCI